MKTLDLHGILPALVTPYKEDESLDEDGLRRLVQHLLADVDGFVVNGTTGDFPLLSPEERERTIKTVVEVASGSKPVIAGTGAISTRETIALTRAAQAAGADAALIVAPYYLRPSPEGLERHFRDVAEAVPDFPILLYNFPQLVGQPIPVNVIKRLRSMRPNIVGMKDTSGNLAYMLEVLETLDPAFIVMVGQGTVALPALASGATGAILACANLVPREWRVVYRAIQQGDLEKARRGQLRAQKVSRLVGKAGSVTVRMGLEMQGILAGPPRRPLTVEGLLSDEDLDVLRQAVQAAPDPE